MGLPSVPSAPDAAEAGAAQVQGQGGLLGERDVSVGADVMLSLPFSHESVGVLIIMCYTNSCAMPSCRLTGCTR